MLLLALLLLLPGGLAKDNGTLFFSKDSCPFNEYDWPCSHCFSLTSVVSPFDVGQDMLLQEKLHVSLESLCRAMVLHR